MIAYILQTSICLFGFYALYLLFLKKETFFSVNRWYLLATLFGSLVIPLLPALLAGPATPAIAAGIEPVAITVQEFTYTFRKPAWYEFHWTDILLVVYLLGAIVQGIRFFKGLLDIYLLYKHGEKSRIGNLTLAETRSPHLPFSFFKVLFISKDYQIPGPDLQKVIRHEQAHAHQWHSIDVLFVEIAGILLWLNPVIYFYRKSLREVHEYLADAVVLQTAPVGKYGRLLLTQSQSGLQMALTNQFFQSQLKNRIQMMTRKRSSQWAGLKYLALVPILLFTIALFSFKNSSPDAPGTEKANLLLPASADTIPVTVKKNGKKTTLKEMVVVGYQEGGESKDNTQDVGVQAPADLADVDEMPTFMGCEEISDQEKKEQCSMEKLMRHVYQQLRYPAEARKAGVQGKVIAAFTVSEQGKVVNTNILKGLGSGIDREVVRVIESLNQKKQPFVPGKKDGKAVAVELTLPVMFKLDQKPDDAKSTESKSEDEEGKVKLTLPDNQQPVYVVDGEQIKAGTLEDIGVLPDNIQKIDVVKNISSAEIERFGKDAENGIIYITTKTGAAEMANTDVKEVFKVVEEMPRFPGCEDSGLEGNELTGCANGKLLEYIAKNLKYPSDARNRLIEGMVVAQFVVSKNGKVRDIQIKRSPGGGTGQAVVDVLQSMNRMKTKWVPGKQRGVTVDVEMTIPVKFKLSDKETEKAKKRIDQMPGSLELTDFQVSPNPSKGMFELSFGTEHDAPVGIHVFDVNGAQVHSALLEMKGSFVNAKVDLRKAAPGNYILMVVQGNERFTTQIQKQ